MKRKFIGVAAALFAVAACNSEKMEDAPLQYGEISVSLAGEPSVEVLSKATALTEDEAADYNVSILDSSRETVYGPVKYSAFETQRLPLGTYHVAAESCTEADAETQDAADSYGCMRLAGETGVVLSAENLAPEVTVECAVANALVTVEFDESVSGRFTDLQVALVSGTRTETIEENGTVKKAWFNPTDEFRYQITGVFTQTGKNVSVISSSSLVLEAKSNLKLLVKVNLENGQITATPTIMVDTDLGQEESVTENFNPYN